MILVTGSNGQLANCLKDIYTDQEAIFIKEEDFDITNLEQMKAKLLEIKPNAIINTAAYTAVDLCEEEKDLAEKVNSTGAENLAILSKELGIDLIHISTDYVFDGNKNTPYKEEDKTIPISQYGTTKLDGEIKILNNTDRAIIIRTSWLYSEHNKNFVKNIIGHMKTKDQLGIVYDQVGSPTYARDLAQAIKEIIPKASGNYGLYHFANQGVTSWYDLTKCIQEELKIDCDINPIETHEYPLPAKRPHYSVLNTSKIKNTFNLHIPYWKESLKLCLQKL
jgi:dTDP-4-dehydrorhamnose reductase